MIDCIHCGHRPWEHEPTTEGPCLVKGCTCPGLSILKSYEEETA